MAIFSYAYVDLNLTLTQNPQLLSILGYLQQLGYFNRPEATVIYVTLIVITFSLFIINLSLFYTKKIGLKYLKISTLINTLILIFAYPFLSSDLFNYIFDAKIILTYHANPYTNRPLDFEGDEWLRFMRWIHRYSPYGPLWLLFSIVPAFLGFGKFILNLFAFKMFIAVFHLINTFLIYKILMKIKNNSAIIGTSFYSLNPLILIEGVANAHNDIVLATFMLLPVYFLTKSNKILATVALFGGTFIKYIPILNLPWLVWDIVSRKKDMDRYITLNLLTMIIFTVIFSSFRISVPFVSSGATQVQFQSWYLLWTLPYVALLSRINFFIVAIVISFGALMRYIPFIYYGNWSYPGTIMFMQAAILIPILMGISYILVRKYWIK